MTTEDFYIVVISLLLLAWAWEMRMRQRDQDHAAHYVLQLEDDRDYWLGVALKHLPVADFEEERSA